jgi:hypothetical protein
MNDRSHAILGALIALGLVLGGWALGAQIKATRLSDRYVTVKGLVERQVKSDLAVWPISFKLAGNELSPLHSSAEAQQKTVLDFLAQQGIKSEEVGVGVVRVIDTQAREYGAERSPYRTSWSRRSPSAARAWTRSPPPRRRLRSCCRKASSSIATAEASRASPTSSPG